MFSPFSYKADFPGRGKQKTKKTFCSDTYISNENLYAGIYIRQKNIIQNIFFNTDISDLNIFFAGSLMGPFFVAGALAYVCMVWCGLPAALMWLCKLHTI